MIFTLLNTYWYKNLKICLLLLQNHYNVHYSYTENNLYIKDI
jgi:hypothetical protein